MTGGGITSYFFYYAPWGMTPQGALYALFFQRHKLLYGTTEEQPGAVAGAFRRHRVPLSLRGSAGRCSIL